MRPSHDTREQTVARLRDGYVDGRIGTDTFALRIDEALHSASHGELRGLTADLPAQPPARLARPRARLRRGRLAAAGALPGPGAPPAARLLIGRSSPCQLVLADDTVSRRHAELRVEDG